MRDHSIEHTAGAMNDSLKNTHAILNQIDDGSNEGRTLQEEVDKEEVTLVMEPKRRTSDADLGEPILVYFRSEHKCFANHVIV